MTPEMRQAFIGNTSGIAYSRMWLRSVNSKHTDLYIPSTNYFDPYDGYTDNPDCRTGQISPYTNSLLMSYNTEKATFNYYTGAAKGESIPAYIAPCFCI